jgi:hypothetical protein
MPETLAAADQPRGRILDPASRLSEILFGVIMALTFTGAFSAAESGREEVRSMLFAAIGCNLAWGLVDAVMFIMNALTTRGRELVTVRAVRNAAELEQARAIIRDAMPAFIAAAMTDEDIDRIRRGMRSDGDATEAARLTNVDWLGAAGVFLLVSLSTFPIVIPFLVFHDARLAIRVSHAIAIGLLFVAGWVLARYSGFRPWRTGFSMVAVGVVLVAITIALGG